MIYRCLPCLNNVHQGCSRYPCTCSCRTSPPSSPAGGPRSAVPTPWTASSRIGPHSYPPGGAGRDLPGRSTPPTKGRATVSLGEWDGRSKTATAPRPGVCSCGSAWGCHEHGPQPREHSVPCRVCGRSTFTIEALCQVHREETK